MNDSITVGLLGTLIERWRTEAIDAKDRGYQETWLARSQDADELEEAVNVADSPPAPAQEPHGCEMEKEK